MSILIFDWLPITEKAWFSIEVEDLIQNRTIILKYIFSEDNRCVWADSNDYFVIFN